MTEIEKMDEFALTINFNNLSESQKIKEIKDLPAQTLHEIMGFFKQYNRKNSGYQELKKRIRQMR
jgi:hypothetical protein